MVVITPADRNLISLKRRLSALEDKVFHLEKAIAQLHGASQNKGKRVLEELDDIEKEIETEVQMDQMEKQVEGEDEKPKEDEKKE